MHQWVHMIGKWIDSPLRLNLWLQTLPMMIFMIKFVVVNRTITWNDVVKNNATWSRRTLKKLRDVVVDGTELFDGANAFDVRTPVPKQANVSFVETFILSAPFQFVGLVVLCWAGWYQCLFVAYEVVVCVQCSLFSWFIFDSGRKEWVSCKWRGWWRLACLGDATWEAQRFRVGNVNERYAHSTQHQQSKSQSHSWIMNFLRR